MLLEERVLITQQIQPYQSHNMLIQRDTNNWSFSTEEQNGLWHLIFDYDKNVITLFHSIGITSTQENLFVGTKEECDQYIVDQNLILLAAEVTPEPYQPEQQYSSQDQ